MGGNKCDAQINYNFYDNKVLSFACALLLIYITTIFKCIQRFWSWGRKSQNLWTAHFSQGQNLWKTLWNGSLPGSCIHVAIWSPLPPPQQKITMLKSDFCPCTCKWTTLIHLSSKGRGHRRISVLWVRKYKTYFVQDSFATYASLKINTKGIFSWKPWLNEKINTFSSHMKLDKINCILIDDGLLNLKDLEILTSVVSDVK